MLANSRIAVVMASASRWRYKVIVARPPVIPTSSMKLCRHFAGALIISVAVPTARYLHLQSVDRRPSRANISINLAPCRCGAEAEKAWHKISNLRSISRALFLATGGAAGACRAAEAAADLRASAASCNRAAVDVFDAAYYFADEISGTKKSTDSDMLTCLSRMPCLKRLAAAILRRFNGRWRFDARNSTDRKCLPSISDAVEHRRPGTRRQQKSANA